MIDKNIISHFLCNLLYNSIFILNLLGKFDFESESD